MREKGRRDVGRAGEKERRWGGTTEQDGERNGVKGGSGETNGPAWRDSSQSIIFKQKQQAQENI